MTEAHQKNAKIAVLKVSYLLAVTVVVFAMPALSLTRPVRWFVIPTLLGIQVITLLVCRVGLRDTLWSASRLKWLFVFLLGMYALLCTPCCRPGPLRRMTCCWTGMFQALAGRFRSI